ncbi:MAG: protein kinase [Polyangiales bacterium]
MLSISDKVKDYEVIAPLGSGGMAMLYLARRRGVGGFSRLVTLKLVHKHLIEDENIIQLFLDEARLSAHVAHPNVVHVEEVGQFEDSYFIAMEYVHGVSLAELVTRLMQRRLRLRPKVCVWLAAQIAEALHAAHEAKNEHGDPLHIVHQDVSPQNVLIGHTGHVKLIDFGIANCQARTDHSTGRRSVLGKLRYMAPEQLRGERADRRTDVYALGVMLWEMLAGRGLFECKRFDDERDWATRENPPPPSRHSLHAMPALDRVVQKALACDPSDRYASAFQFRAALLRADPSAMQLDAPLIAGLLRSMIGDELDRRRASWPRDIAQALEPTPDVTMSQKQSLHELTADYVASGPVSEPGPLDAAEPDESRAASATTTGRKPASPPSAADAGASQPLPRSVLQSALETLKLRPQCIHLAELLLSERAFRGAAVGFVCLTFGVYLGALLSPANAPQTAHAASAPATAAATSFSEPVSPRDPQLLTAGQPNQLEPPFIFSPPLQEETPRAAPARKAWRHAHRSDRRSKPAVRSNGAKSPAVRKAHLRTPR